RTARCYPGRVLEPSPQRPSRARPGTLAERATALGADAALALTTALPATALGANGPFEVPARTDTLRTVPSSIIRIPVHALAGDRLEDEVDLGSARFELPEGVDGATRAQMSLREDSRSLEVQGEGTWTLLGERLVFTPLYGVEGPSTPIALTIGGLHE